MRRQKLLIIALVVVVAGSAGIGAATATGLLVRRNGAIAFAHGNNLLAVSLKRPGVRRLWSCRKPLCNIYQLAWSPDGRRLAFVQGYFDGQDPSEASHMFLYVMAVGGKPERLASCGDCGRGLWTQLSWSPDGKRIAYSRSVVYSRSGLTTENIWIVPAAGGKPHRLTHCRSDCRDVDPRWSPNGRLLAFVDYTGGTPWRRVYTVRRDGSHLTAIANGADPQWSPDGRRIAFDGDSRGVEVADADGSHNRLLYPQTGGAGPGVPSWSPDGKKLVFFNTPNSGSSAEVWTINADGTAPQRLYSSGCCVSVWAAPIWSPDGRKIAFGADAAGGTYVLNADGSGLKQLSPFVSASPDPSSMLSWQRLPERTHH